MILNSIQSMALIVASVAAFCAVCSLVLTVINFIKQSKRPCKIKYIPQEAFNIVKSFNNDFKNFEIRYDDEPINNNLMYLSGELLLKKGDINTRDNQIYIKFPSKLRHLVITKSDDLISADIKKDDNDETKALLTFDLLRRNQSIKMKAILEVEKGIFDTEMHDFQKSIEFSHQIAHTDDIKMDDYSTPSVKSFVKLFLSLLIILLAIFLGYVRSSGYSGSITFTDDFIDLVFSIVLAIISFLILLGIIKRPSGPLWPFK